LAAQIARLTESGALAGIVALPSGRIVATFGSCGGVPSGAPGTGVVVVVVVVLVVSPAAGDAATRAAANSTDASASLLHRRLERDGKRSLLRFLLMSQELGFSSAGP
jgi:hypothetical protein